MNGFLPATPPLCARRRRAWKIWFEVRKFSCFRAINIKLSRLGATACCGWNKGESKQMALRQKFCSNISGGRVPLLLHENAFTRALDTPPKDTTTQREWTRREMR